MIGKGKFRVTVALLLSVAVLALTLLALFATSMNALPIHDENMFVSVGSLFSRTSLLPYRDFPFIHAPYIGAVFALAMRISERSLLVTRMVSVLFAWLTLVLIYIAAWVTSRGRPYWQRFVIAAGIVLLILVNPEFRYGALYAWNHQLSTFLAMASFLLVWPTKDREPDARSLAVFSSGILLGLAAGVRLTWVLCGPAYLLLAFMRGNSWRGRWTAAAWFTGGTVVANLPILLFLVFHPQEVWFGMVGWHQYDTLAHAMPGFLGPALPMSLRAKVVYLAQTIGASPADLMLYFGTGFFFLNALLFRERSRAYTRELLLFFVLLSVFAGSLSPTPVFISYFYEPVPWLALTILYSAFSAERISNPRLLLFTTIVSTACLYGLRSYPNEIAGLRTPEAWPPNRIHAVGKEIGARVKKGPLLTLNPIYAAEAGMDFYEQLAVGEIAWRAVAPIPKEERARFNVVGPDELEQMLRNRPPGGIVLGPENDMERPMLHYAQEHGYRPTVLAGGSVVLWTLPEASP